MTLQEALKVSVPFYAGDIIQYEFQKDRIAIAKWDYIPESTTQWLKAGGNGRYRLEGTCNEDIRVVPYDKTELQEAGEDRKIKVPNPNPAFTGNLNQYFADQRVKEPCEHEPLPNVFNFTIHRISDNKFVPLSEAYAALADRDEKYCTCGAKIKEKEWVEV